ncbi:beta strand repeat-containing protein [Streptomyces sp. NPDC091280]|uniref:beta strand repeat-containing protein n=1 Tax=Streptomyces sp. NPDC091280 TaxID=3365984 RepID=UPI00382603B7
MARRHTTGWEVLGFANDPTPGDPDAIRTLARTYQDLGDGAGEAVDLLAGDGAIRQGKGKAMDGLREKINKDLPGMLAKTRDSFRHAAEAYTTYADTLTNAQDMLDRAIDEGQEVEATAKSDVPTLAADATPDQVQAHDTQQGQVDEAKSRLSAAEALGRDAERLREDGSRRASVILDEAAAEAIPERNILKKFGDFLADNPFVEIIAGIIVGIVAVFFPFVGVLLGAALLGASLIRMASQGKFDAGDIIIGILTLVPGGVLLGALGKVGGVVTKLAKLAPVLAKLGKGAGTISGALAKIIESSTLFRKVISPLGKGLVGLGANPALAALGKAGIDVGTEFTLGFAAAGITAAADGKKFDLGPAAIGSLIGAASGGVLSLFGGTRFANRFKDAFTTKGKFKSNIDKAFSTESLGFTNGKFKATDIFHVNGKELPQKSGFHGINGSTTSEPATGILKTKATTPDGTKTEGKITPAGGTSVPGDGGRVDDLPFSPAKSSTGVKTTTPDGFTSETKNGANTIKSPAGDAISSNGTTTKIDTPVPGKGASPVNTELKPNGDFTTSGSFGSVDHSNGVTTISSPGADGQGTTPQFTLNGHEISTSGGVGVTDRPDFGGVHAPGISVDNQNGVHSVFNTSHPDGTAVPVITHNPADGSVNVNLGTTTFSADSGNLGHGVSFPDGSHASVDNGGTVHFDNGGPGGQGVTVPPPHTNQPVTVTDGGTTTHLNPGGGATVNAPGHTTTLDNNGFTVNTGGANPDTVQFHGNTGTLDVTPGGGGHAPVTVHPGGDIAVGGITTDHTTGGGSATNGTHTVDFDPAGFTVKGADGNGFGVGRGGDFSVDGIHHTPGEGVTAGGTTVRPDGSAVIQHDGQRFDVGANGQITAHPTGGTPGVEGAPQPTAAQPGVEGAPQPTPGNPVSIGNTTVSVDGDGGHTVTVHGQNGATVSVNNGTTTLDHGPVQISHGPNGTTGTTGGATPVQITHGPDGIATVTHGGTTVSTGADVPTTVDHGPHGTGQPPAVTVTPGADGHPTTVTTADGSNSTLTKTGAHTDVDGGNAANGSVGPDGTISTSAPAGANTTVDHGPHGTVATDNGSPFAVDDAGTVTNGNVTVHPDGEGAATIADIGDNGADATLTPNGIDTQGVTTSVDGDGGIVFTHQPDGGGPVLSTVTVDTDGGLTAHGPDGSAATLPPTTVQHPGGGVGANPEKPTVISEGGNVVTSDGTTITHSDGGFTTTVTDSPNGPVTTTVQDTSGVGHTIDGNGQATVHNSPSGAEITGTNTQVTVNTPPEEGPGLFGHHADVTGGENTLSNGPNGPTITTKGADPIAEPGSVVTHDTAPGHEGEFTTTYGPAQGTFGPGGVQHLGPSGTHLDPNTHVPIDTAGRPIGNGPGQTPISTIHGDGASGVTLTTPGGGPSVSHEGFVGGKTTVDTGHVTVTKTPNGRENAGTAGQKSGVVDGPLNPTTDTPPHGPETFTVGGKNGGPSVDVPVGGSGKSTVHGGDFDVKAKGDGSFEVSVPGGGGGPDDSVVVGKDGSLSGADVNVQGLDPGVQGPVPPPHATLSNGTTVFAPTEPGTAPSAHGPSGSTTTFDNNGTATTHHPDSGTTITQHPGGHATFSSTAGGDTTTVNVKGDGVSGSVTKPDGSTFGVDVGSNGAAKVKDAGGDVVTHVDPVGSVNEQHSPVHEYYSYTSSPVPPTETREYLYEGFTSILKGVFNQTVSGAYQIGVNHTNPLTVLENAGIRIGNGIGSSLGNKQLENTYIFKTKGPETAVSTIPTKVLGQLNNNADIDFAHSHDEKPVTL